jgi:hypothetical protein
MEKDTLIKLIETGLSQQRIAEELNCSQSTIRWWLKKYDLRTRRGKHSQWPKDLVKARKCSYCGETNPIKFYGHKKTICGNCHNKYTYQKSQENRLQGIKYLGGECNRCGYNEFTCSLDFHHKDPKNKHPVFGSHRGWSLKKLLKELEKCILLCKNCHAALHANKFEA